ncbi:MAG: GtrA family protein [Lachnotalea sp.]
MSIFEKIWQLIEKIAKVIIYGMLKKIGVKISEEQWITFMQFIKFGIVGLSNTFVAYAIYLICLFLGFHYLVGNAVGFVASVLNSFYWNYKYVFKSNGVATRRSMLKMLLKTFMAYGITGLLLSNVLLIVWVQFLHISKVIAPLINLIITIPLNFVINKLWAFK